VVEVPRYHVHPLDRVAEGSDATRSTEDRQRLRAGSARE
jgi:hypothetical protein